EALVLAKANEQNEKYLCAYVTTDGVMDKLKLKEYLQESLPDYMVPAYIIEIESFPLTTNGKIDKKSLPEATHAGLIHSSDYVAPRTKIEEKLVDIWSEILRAEIIGIDDNFFDLGGNSLKASLMINTIHKEMNKAMPLRSFFENATIRSISKHIDGNVKIQTYKGIGKAELRDYYKTSSVQKRLYTFQQIEPKSTTYNIPVVFELSGHIEKDRIEKTFKKLIERHEAFRTSFNTINGEIVQNIQSEYTFSIVEKKEDSKTIQQVMRDFIRFFSLEEAPLCRVGVVELGDKKYLLIDMHHIITDGLSMKILMKDFVRMYNGHEIEPLKIQYKDFSEWQHKFLQSKDMKEMEDYWTNKFSGELPILSLPYDFDRPVIQSYNGQKISFSLDESTAKGLRRISKQTESSMFMVLLSAFNILLAKYSGQEDIIVGTPAAGRTHPDLEPIVGMFVNTLALRNNPCENKSFTKFLKEIKENSIKAFENQSYQFEELLEKVNVGKDLRRNPIFDVMFTMNHHEEASVGELDKLQLKPIFQPSDQSKFDLTLHVTENKRTLRGSIEYSISLFKEETIERMIKHFKQIVASICRNPNAKLSEIEMMTESEKRLILYGFNDTQADYDREKTLQELFEDQADKRPDHIAVKFRNHYLTYRELNEKSNQLVRVLRQKGVTRHSIVGLMTENSLEMMVGILGVLKSGGAYLPIDP
ncbi:condensation domain-containing protein, partial [Bacillus velezensis]|uniref:condensation domain-containing protein n=3 Tax=Bacteria TaxID=2 RepID=UPI003C1FE5B0